MPELTEQDYRRSHPRPWTEVFGDPQEPVGTRPGLEETLEPAKGSTASRMAKHVHLHRRAAARDREERQLEAAATEVAEDRALETALDLVNRRKPIPEAIRVLAVAALAARGGSLSSAEIMAARALGA